MVHSLRKYLTNRGSALFMVLSTMTALMITCMAMYFAVVSSRSAGFAVFNQQQSYQSALSIAEMTVGSLGDILTNSGVSIESVPVGETILTTDGNGFKALNPASSGEDDDYLGAYDVTMTRLADETIDKEKFFTVDIAVTTSVSGVKEVYHQVVNIIQEDGTPNQKGKIFSSTGYVPNDSFVSKGRFYSDVYISNEDAIMGAFDGNELHFFQNIFCENSLTLLDGTTPQNYAEQPIIHAARRNYNIGSGNPLGFYGNSIILVGYDMHLARGFNVSSSEDILDVYIGGDLYLDEGAQNLNDSKLRFYVAGNVYVNASASNSIPGVVYCKKFIFKEGYSKTNYNSGSEWEEGLDWEEDQYNKHGKMSMSFREAMEMLDSKTPNIQYKLWKLDESKLGSAIGTTQTDGSIKGGKKIDLNFKCINNQAAFAPIEIKYGSSEYGVGGIIQNITIDREGTEDGKMPTLIIDTGDDPSNTYVIRLQNNNKSNDGTEYFTWRPKCPSGSLAGYPVQVLVKGNGSLVIDVPDGVIYQDASSGHVMHYNWYMLGDTNSGLGYQDGVAYYKNTQGIQGSISDYVHSSCTEGDGCDYTVKKTSDACSYCGNEVTYSVKCDEHDEYTICPNCEPDYFSGDEKKPTINPAGICKDRVEKETCESDLRLIEKNYPDRPVNKDSKGNIIIPNCNIFLVSCSESAEFRFGRTIDDEYAIDKNCFIGFIYAPYMSYKANGKDAGEYYMHVGGMVVSDYKFLSLNRFLACWPSVYPPQNVLNESALNTTLNPVSEKRYRVRLKATY